MGRNRGVPGAIPATLGQLKQVKTRPASTRVDGDSCDEPFGSEVAADSVALPRTEVKIPISLARGTKGAVDYCVEEVEFIFGQEKTICGMMRDTWGFVLLTSQITESPVAGIYRG